MLVFIIIFFTPFASNLAFIRDKIVKEGTQGNPSTPPDTSDSVIVLQPDPNDDFTPDPIPAPCNPTGYFKSAYAYHKKKVGDSSDINRGAPISYQFVVTNSCTANFYLETGLVQEQINRLFTILVATPSACDGNKHYAGKFVQGNSNTKFTSTQPAGVIDVAFFPEDYDKEETLIIVGGVYSDCLKNRGVTIANLPPQELIIRNSYSDTEITASVTKII